MTEIYCERLINGRKCTNFAAVKNREGKYDCGEHNRPARVIKQGRNEKCRCGSGLKFKKCCMQLFESGRIIL